MFDNSTAIIRLERRNDVFAGVTMERRKFA